MSSFVNIAKKNLHGAKPEEPQLHDHENLAALKEDIARLQEILHYQEAKIAQMHAMLTERDSKLSIREQECDQKAKMVTAALGKLKQVKEIVAHELAKAKKELEEAENRHQEDVKRYEARIQQLETSLQQASHQLEILKKGASFVGESGVVEPYHALRKQSENITRTGSRVNSSPNHGPSEEILYSGGYDNEWEGVPQETPMGGKEATPLGYSPVENGLYLRGTPNLSCQESRLRLLEAKLEKMAQELLQMKREGHEIPAPHEGPSRGNFSQGMFSTYDALQEFLDS